MAMIVYGNEEGKTVSLAPKVPKFPFPLAAPFREAPLREDHYPQPVPTDATIADAKRSFAELRVQAELGHEEIGGQNPG